MREGVLLDEEDSRTPRARDHYVHWLEVWLNTQFPHCELCTLLLAAHFDDP